MTPVPVLDVRDQHRAEVDRAVDDFGVSRGWDAAKRAKAKRISHRTIFAECDWWLLANRSVPESMNMANDSAVIKANGQPVGYGKDLDSVGLYQQRRMWWGDTAGSMSPYTSTIRYWAHTLANTPDWYVRAQTDDGEADVAQRTQGSQFDGKTIDPRTGKPYPYAQNYKDRQTQTDAMDLTMKYYTEGGK